MNMVVKVVVALTLLSVGLVQCYRDNLDVVKIMAERILGTDIPYEKPRADLMKMALMTVPEVISYHGYPYEIHKLVTSDGYGLTLHRIPHGKSNGTRGGIPVYLQHGVLSSSMTFTTDEEDSIAFFLADRGYDVWMGNIRGNVYSHSHTSLNPKEKEFWNFSWEDCADNDLPESIDYVLSKIDYSDVLYLGHSMGTTMAFALLASKPEYQNKIKGVIALGPVANLNYMTSIIGHHASQMSTLIELVAATFRIYDTEKMPVDANSTIFHLCPESKPLLCELIVDASAGYVPASKNPTRFFLRFLRIRSGASIKTLLHFKQMHNNKKLARFDYGNKINNVVYNNTDPWEYELESINTPVAIFYASNDALADPLDVHLLSEKLPNVVTKYLLPGAFKRHDDLLFDQGSNGFQYFKVVEQNLESLWRM